MDGRETKGNLVEIYFEYNKSVRTFQHVGKKITMEATKGSHHKKRGLLQTEKTPLISWKLFLC